VGRGRSLGRWDDVCVVFRPSPFCKPFVPPHPHTWHPVPSLLCAPLGVEGTPSVTIQTRGGGPKNLGQVLQVLPGAGAAGLDVAWGRGPGVCPPSSVKSLVGFLARWLCRHRALLRASLGDAGCGFWGPREQGSASAPPAASWDASSGQQKGPYLGAVWCLKVLCSTCKLLLNLKLFYNRLQVGMTPSEAAVWGAGCWEPCARGHCLVPVLLSLMLSFGNLSVFNIFFLFFLCPKGFPLHTRSYACLRRRITAFARTPRLGSGQGAVAGISRGAMPLAGIWWSQDPCVPRRGSWVARGGGWHRERRTSVPGWRWGGAARWGGLGVAAWLGKVTAMLWASGTCWVAAGLLCSSLRRAGSGEVLPETTGISSHLSPGVSLPLLGLWACFSLIRGSCVSVWMRSRPSCLGSPLCSRR